MFTFLVLDISQEFPPAKKFKTIADLANVIFPNLFIIAAVILFGMILLSGFSVLRSGGNPEELKKTQKLLTYSIAGFIIVIASYVLVRLLGVILNIQLPFL